MVIFSSQIYGEIFTLDLKCDFHPRFMMRFSPQLHGEIFTANGEIFTPDLK